MTYKCSRRGCGKTAARRDGLKCQRCDSQEARTAGVTPIYVQPPGYTESLVTGGRSSEDSSNITSGGGGDFGGGGASGDY